MAVTTANTLKFSDVCNELYGSTNTSGRSLMTAHANANPTYFNPNYAVTGNTLLDFRGYGGSLAWRAIDQYCVQDADWTLILKTRSKQPNWCLNRFRLYTADSNTLVQARKPDGTVIDTQVFSDPNYTWGAAFEHSFMFNLSYNTTQHEVEIYITGVPVGAKFQQLYAMDAHAGTAVRYAEDPAASGMGTYDAELTLVNFEFLRFDEGHPSSTTSFVYIENENIHTILGADKFYGKTLDVSNNSLDSATIDSLIIGCDNQGRTNGYLKISGNAARTSASNTAWTSLGNKGWTLI